MFVGDNSWSFVDIMKINAQGYIDKPIEEWPLYEEYKRAKSIVENPCVVNDAAERSVRLVSDFLYLVHGKKKIYSSLIIIRQLYKPCVTLVDIIVKYPF